MFLAAAAAGLILVSFLLSFVLCAGTRRYAPRFGLVDKPGGRKAHRAATPLGGGVAICLTVIFIFMLGAVVVFRFPGLLPPGVNELGGGLRAKASSMGLTLALACCVMVMGLIDDRWGLGWPLRLGVQVGLALVFTLLSHEQITLFVSGPGRVVMVAVTVVWIVGLTNAFNFLDNMDGLAASVGLIACLLFAGAQLAVESRFVPAALLVLVGTLAGFLVHNAPPARLFMGDAGSNFLGFMLGALTVMGTYYRPGYSPYSVLTPLLVMAVPIYDMVSVITIRLREGRSPFQADRRHFSHRLVERGLTPARAVATIDLVTLAGGLGALLLHDKEVGPIAAAVVVAQTVCLLGVVAVLEVAGNRQERRNGQARSEEPQTHGGAETGPGVL
jgi:UDP-GlcNAc:undecaprenyl-phosphate GlcNAc-1-phosphate transferase